MCFLCCVKLIGFKEILWCFWDFLVVLVVVLVYVVLGDFVWLVVFICEFVVVVLEIGCCGLEFCKVGESFGGGVVMYVLSCVLLVLFGVIGCGIGSFWLLFVWVGVFVWDMVVLVVLVELIVLLLVLDGCLRVGEFEWVEGELDDGLLILWIEIGSLEVVVVGEVVVLGREWLVIWGRFWNLLLRLLILLWFCDWVCDFVEVGMFCIGLFCRLFKFWYYVDGDVGLMLGFDRFCWCSIEFWRFEFEVFCGWILLML